MIKSIISEFLGTFLFLGVILASKDALIIGIGLIAAIVLTTKFSGGNLNPVVSLMLFVDGKLDLLTMISYMIAQSLGGLTALWFFRASNISNGKKSH